MPQSRMPPTAPQHPALYLTFHGIGDPVRPLEAGEEEVWLTVADFEQILDVVRDRAEVGITFDDGNASDRQIAMPALLSRNLTATFFVLAGKLDEPGYLRTSDLVELRNAGMAVGSHGLHHQPWPDLDPPTLENEITGSKKRLEDILGEPVFEAACPFGSYNRRVLRGLRRAGYRTVFTSDRGQSQPKRWLQPRNTVPRGTSGNDVTALLSHRPSPISLLTRELKLLWKRFR